MTTPKEKAEELVKKFTAHAHGEDGEQSWINATLCALICCDEAIKTAKYKAHIETACPEIETAEYWQEVKNELNKM